MRRLLAAAGPRKAAYLTAWLTGLRRKELRALRWGDVRLDATPPYLSVRASTTKNRRVAVIGLRDDLAAELRAVRPDDVSPAALVWGGGLPRMTAFRADLAAAGIAFIDAQGRRADFHALRHTLATNLGRAGVAPRVAMEVMRHSDMRLTMRTYTDVTQLPTSEAMEKLPRLSGPAPVPAAEVTHGDSHELVPACPAVSTEGGWSPGGGYVETADIPRNCQGLTDLVASCQPEGGNSAGRTRTYNQPVNSRLLYH